MLSLLSKVNAAVWKQNLNRTIFLMTDFAQAFQNDHNNISDAVERDQSAAGQVIPFQCAKSHDFFDALEKIFFWCFHHSFLIRYFKMCIKTW